MTTHGAPAGIEHGLIDDLRGALAAVEAAHPEWFENPTIRLFLDLGVSAARTAPGGPVDLDNASGRIAARLGEVVAGGVSEAFLVRAVRDRVTALVEEQADAGAADEARARGRALGLPLPEVDPDEAAGVWAVRDAWAAAAGALTDERIAAWQQRAGRRAAGLG